MRIIVVRDFSHLDGHEKLALHFVLSSGPKTHKFKVTKNATSSFSVSRRRMGQNDVGQALFTTTSA